ncbi:hypothetical protein ACS0TY_008013 [Phlomoides rotata]
MSTYAGLTEPPDLIKKGLVVCREKRNDHSVGVFYGLNPLDFSFPLFLLQLSSLIILTHLVRFILRPLRQPKVVSEILGGIILGPSVLSRSKKFQAYMFPWSGDFVIKNLGLVGFMYFLFLSGVKTDIMVIKRARKKHWCIGLLGVLLPLVCSLSVALAQRKSLDKQLGSISSIWGMSISFTTAAFPVLYPIIKELNLLSSGIGRMALTTAVISDVIGLNALLVFETWKQGEHKPIIALWYIISFVIIAGTFIGGARQGMMWIIRTTPEEKAVDQVYVVGILVGVLVCGLISGIFGLTVANGPLWLGLAVPDGPPLGAILVERTESIVKNLLMPFSFMYMGMIIDFSSMVSQWSHVQPLVFMVVSSYLVKMVSTLVASRYFKMTIRDSLTLSLVISLKGEVEILLFIHLVELKVIGRPHFTFMVLSATAMTALATPLISILYDPTRPYLMNKRRNIQHTPPNTELHIVACIHGEENLSGLMKLLEISNPDVNSPLTVYALCLVELVGRSNPVLIDHDNEETVPNQCTSSSIHNALKNFQEARDESIKIFSYTTITSRKSMYQDICGLALSKKACLIILPYYKPKKNNRRTTVNSNVLLHAPCSVAILLDKSPHQNLVHGVLRSSMHRMVVLFLGGADAREALTYADRMAERIAVSLTVVRFLAHDNEGDDEMEKKLDDGLVTQFWVKREGNERVVYREVVVKNGEETIAAIQGMKKDIYDLWIVGRRNGINPVLLKGLSNWSDQNNELGVIGEYVASVDFDSTSSVLAVQQQILRGQENNSHTFLKCFSFSP